MRTPLIVAVVLAAGMANAVQAQPGAKLQGWTYHTDSRYLSSQYADKTGHMLNDGDHSKHLVIYSGGHVTLNITLPRLTKITSVVAYVTRPNDNYELKDWTVSARIMGHWQSLGSGKGFWGHTQQRAFRLEIKGLHAQTEALRLGFDCPGVLAIAELELYGQAAAAPQASEIVLPLVNSERPSAREEDVDHDGKPEVVLENSLVRLIFWPQTGGICRSFLYKPAGCEMVAPQSGQYGMFRDQLWAPNYSFAQRPYRWRTGGDARTAWVELSGSGAGGMMGFTSITKRITITRDSPVVRVHYKLQNDPSSQTDYTYGLWFHNFLGVPGGENRYYDPTEQGVEEYAFDPGQPVKQSEVWYKDPARGWTAFCSYKGAGMALGIDYKYLYCFYHWAGVGVPVATQEWRFNRLTLKAGQSLQTDITVMPFQGLPRVDGVVGDLIGAISLDRQQNPNTATVRALLASPTAAPETLAIRLRSLPRGAWRQLGRLSVVAGKMASRQVSLADLAQGSYVLNCQVMSGGKTLDDFERPFVRGTGQLLAYRRQPLEKRVGLGPEAKAGLPRHDLSDAVVTPHIPWANPLAGGPIKAIVLCDDFVNREIVELQERLQLDVTYVKFRTTFWKESLYCGDRSISTPAQAQKRLLDYLQHNKYDLFILAGFNWQAHFTPAIREAFTQQIKNGAGLVFIEPDGFKASDELAPMMGLAKGRSMYQFARWQRAKDSPLTAGLPWDLYPETRYMDYTRWPEGQVLATLGPDKPLLVTNSLGKGRTVCLTYDTLTHAMSYRGYAGLTPIISYRGAFLRPEYKQMTWNYWEPWYALLARVATWAAHRDTGVNLVSLEPIKDAVYGRQGQLPLKLSGGAGEYRVSVDFTNRYSEPLKHEELTYTAGQDQVEIPLPPNLGAGINPVSVIVRNPAGESVAWGETYVKCQAPVAIKSLTVEKKTVLGTRAPRRGQLYDRTFRSSEPFRVKVAFKVVLPLAGQYRVRARLYDTHHRLLSEQIKPLAPDGADMSFEAWPQELRSMGVEWDVAVLGPRGQTDLQRARVVAVAPRDWNRFFLTSWGGLFPWRSEYLYQYLAPLVDNFVDVSFAGSTEIGTGKTWLNMWYNIGTSYLGLLQSIGKGVPDFADKDFAQKFAKYNDTRDKKYLIRNPSLEDPKYRAEIAAHARAVATDELTRGGAYDYCMGDEMSLTYYTRYFDFDWSPYSLAAFRQWLQARYPSLTDLNKAWATNFATWNQVVPMTLDEVKQRANAAPWCEFRDFMNDSVAGFFAMILRNLKSVDPEAKAGLSGTQEPRAGNGMDWWKDSLAFNYYHSYNTGWSNEMRRSFAPYTGVMQSPYYAGYWVSGRDEEQRFFWCLLHDTDGISAWDTNIFFYNDFTYSESGRDTKALCQEMKRGLWDAVRSGQRLQDGIAIHYSQDTINAAQLFAREDENKNVRDVWVKLLEDLGLQYNFVATPQIEAGLLTHPKPGEPHYKVLILPQSFAISDKEKAEIEAFVRNGGVVIADNGAGLVDGKCRKGAAGMLDNLFGIKRTGGAVDGAAGVQVDLGQARGQLKFPVAEALSPTTAKAYGHSLGKQQTPVLLCNKVGRGTAWYLNLDLRPFDAERTFHTPAEKLVRAIALQALDSAGVKPQYHVTMASGQAPHVELVRYRAGDLVYLGAICTDGKEQMASISLPMSRYVYDCRAGESLGKRNVIRTTFEGGQCRVYLLSPRPLIAPKLTLTSPPSITQGEAVKYNVALPGGLDRAKQVVHLTVTRPDGKNYSDYSRNLILGHEPFSGSFRLALNDSPGTWKVTVRDVASGVTSAGQFKVVAR